MDNNELRQQIRHLKSMSLTSNASYDAPITKRDLERFRNEIIKALNLIACQMNK